MDEAQQQPAGTGGVEGGRGPERLSAVEQAAVHRAVAVRIVRMAFAVLVFTVVLVSILGGGKEGNTLAANPWQRWIIPGSTAVIVVVGILAADL